MSNETKRERKPFNVKLFYRRTCLIIYDIISVIGASYIALLMRYSFDMLFYPFSSYNKDRRIQKLQLPPEQIQSPPGFHGRKPPADKYFAGETELQNLVMSSIVSAVCYSVGIQFFRVKGEQAVPSSYYFLYVLIPSAHNLDALNKSSPFACIVVNNAADYHGGKIAVHDFLDNQICRFTGPNHHDGNTVVLILLLML